MSTAGQHRTMMGMSEKSAHKITITRIADAVLAALVLTLFLVVAKTADFDINFADKLYTNPVKPSENIVIFAIDRPTIDRLGSLSSWARRDLPDMINYLNEHEPSARPAAIGIDMFFQGEKKSDPASDRRLAEACARYGNVVTAGTLNVPDEELEKNEKTPLSIYDNPWDFEGSYEQLAKATKPSHVVIPCETDGITRHMLYFVKTKNLGDIPSFSSVLYNMWCERTGHTPAKPPVTDENGIYYLPFSSAEYKTYSLIDLLDGKITGDDYRDKIVLIGRCYPGNGDTFHTPLTSTDIMYGVVVHANAIQAFERGTFPQEVSDKWQFALFFIICAVAEYYFRILHMPHTIILWLALSIFSVVFCWCLYRIGFIFHPTWIPAAATVLFAWSLAGNYMRIKGEQIKSRTVYERYFDGAVLERLLDEDSEELKLGGREREIAVLFADIRGFTTISEKRPTAEVVDVLNRYLKATTECVRDHRGTLDKFVGDCIMAFWNAPEEQKFPVHRACRAALAMIKSGKELQDKIKQLYGYDVTFGVGVHWGNAIVGNIGSEFRMDYTAIGDTVNTAARLEGVAEGGTVLVSKAVADILGEDAELIPLDSKVKLKGKEDKVEVFALKSMKTDKGVDK